MVLVKSSFRVHSLNELNRTTIFYTGVVIPDSAQCRVVCSANAALSYSPKEPDWRQKNRVDASYQHDHIHIFCGKSRKKPTYSG